MKTESENEKLSPEETAVDNREKEGRRTIIYGAGDGIRTHAALKGPQAGLVFSLKACALSARPPRLTFMYFSLSKYNKNDCPFI